MATSWWRDPDVLLERRDRLRFELDVHGLAGCLITGDSDRTWSSGFGSASHGTVPTAVLLVGRDHDALLTSANNVDWAASEAPGLDVIPWRRPWWATLGAELLATGWPTIGFEPDHLSVRAYDTLMDVLETGAAFMDLGAIVAGLRAVKDDAEIRTLRRAVQITDLAFYEATEQVTAGTTERELASRLDAAMRRHGASDPGFPTIVASGPNAARPHHSPTDRAILPGEPVIIDMGARFDGYTADLTRTIWVGDPDPRLAEIYAIILEANRVAQEAARPGVSGRDVDSSARELIQQAGFGDAFIHGLGHGVGLDIHEAPSAGQQSDDILVAGNTLTIEPGIYLPGWGGVRIEDMGVVTEDGFDCFTGAPKAEPPRTGSPTG